MAMRTFTFHNRFWLFNNDFHKLPPLAFNYIYIYYIVNIKNVLSIFKFLLIDFCTDNIFLKIVMIDIFYFFYHIKNIH